MTNEIQKEQAKYLIGRYDSYYNVANVKGYYLMGYQFFIIGTVVLNSHKWSSLFQDYNYSSSAFKYAMLVLLVTAIFGVLFVLISIFPFLGGSKFSKSSSNNDSVPDEAKQRHSLIFFRSVGSMSFDEFDEEYSTQTEEDLLEDFKRQAHILGKGLKKKFTFLRYSGRMIYIHVFVILTLISLYAYETI